MSASDGSNASITYPDVIRHWSPESEKYTGGDALTTLLLQGWEIRETVSCETYWHGGSRPTDIYHIELVRDSFIMSIAVMTNPYVRRLVNDASFQLRLFQKQVSASMPGGHRH